MTRDPAVSRPALVPSVPDLVFCGIALVFAIGAPVVLTQSDGDLFAHIRLGVGTLATGHVPTVSMFGYSTDGVRMVSPAWMSEVLFALMFRVGGLALVATVIAIVAAATHGIVALLLRKRGADARWVLAAALLSLLLGVSHWMARPHAFSIFGAAVLLALLEWDDWRSVKWIALVILLWTNLHGGWVFGVGVIGLYAAGDAFDAWRSGGVERWERARRHLVALAVAAAATLVNPYGLALHHDVLQSVFDPSLANIIEYRPPSFDEIGDMPLILALIGGVAALVMARLRMRTAWLLIIAANVFFSLKARRHIPLFGVTAWPLIAIQLTPVVNALLARSKLFADAARVDARARVGTFAGAVAVVLLALGLAGGTIGQRQLVASAIDPRRFPVRAVERLRNDRFDGRIFTEWTWGGYLAFAWPGQRGFVDPLKFGKTTMNDYARVILLEPRWREELDRWNVDVILMPRRAHLVAALRADPTWNTWYEDSTAVVFRRAPNPHS